jgi:hypothetical protein
MHLWVARSHVNVMVVAEADIKGHIGKRAERAVSMAKNTKSRFT